jgi:hypothetical protein
MRKWLKFTPGLILIVYIFVFLIFRHPAEKWDRIINSDGKGYYGYLTAIFIYHDLNFRFIESYEAKYYPEDKVVFKDYRVPACGKVVNKCFAGLAIAWLPFFLIAHFLSSILGYPPDGYSMIYQYSIAVAAFFYLWLGLFILFKLLRKFNATDMQASFITLIIGLGTNLMYYTVIEGSMSHVYSFSLITVFLYSVWQLFHSGKGRWFFLSAFLLAVIILIRPPNILILLLVPVMSEGWKNIRETWDQIMRKPLIPISGIVVFMIVLAIQMSIWYLQTGHFLVYSYGTESFDFLNPHAFSILFSYNRGWFIYTPLAFISMAGLAGIFRENKAKFLWVLFFLIALIYVASSWWMWYYASKSGQRIFVDMYALIAILLVYLFRMIRNKRISVLILASFCVLLTGLNLVQFYQHIKWIFPATYITRQIYWDSFFTIHPKARVYLPQEAIIEQTSFFNDMEKDLGWMNPGTLSDIDVVSGKRSSKIDSAQAFSSGLEEKIQPQISSINALIKISAYVLSKGLTSISNLVVDYQLEGKSFCYTAFNLDPFVSYNKWVRIEYAIYVPRDYPENAFVKIYFYNPSASAPLFIDDLRIDFISLNDDLDNRSIDGVKVPCRK